MKILLYLFLLFFLVGCESYSKKVYWCGDHPCINKKEREAYFKKTMIVEVKEFEKKDKKSNSEIEKIINQAKLDEKKRIKDEKALAKQAKLDEKRRIAEEKALAKQAKLDEKRRINEEKDLKKKISEDKKMLKKKQKNKQSQKVELSTKIGTMEIKTNKFGDLVNKIIKRNSLRPYPDINDIPN